MQKGWVGGGVAVTFWTFLSFISAGPGTECEAATRLGGTQRPLPVQYFILTGPGAARGVSGEEQWENTEGDIHT